MSFIQPLGQLRASVATYSALPLSGNNKGDIRLTLDIGAAYTWISNESSGEWVSWKRVTVSNYNDLTGRPSSSPLAIDDAIQSIRNLYLNYILMFFKSLIVIGMNTQKMFDGIIDVFSNLLTFDETKSSNYIYIKTPSLAGYDYFYTPKFNSNLDSYTKILVHGQGYNNGGFDAFRHTILNIEQSDVVSHFLDTVIQPSISEQPANICAWDMSLNDVANKNFTWDFWSYCTNQSGIQNLIEISSQICGTDDANFKIQKLDNGKIYVYMLTADGANPEYNEEERRYLPINPVEVELTSVSTLSTSTWYHIALQRQNGYLKLYINGVLDATSLTSSEKAIFTGYPADDIYLNNVRIGRDFFGYFDEIRYSHDIARYSSTFTPMTVPYNNPTNSAPCNNMVIQSNGFEANEAPSSARVVLFIQYPNLEAENLVPITDIKVYVSRDGGTTFTQATDLKREMDVMQYSLNQYMNSKVDFFVGTIDLHLQPNGKEIVYKITTHNNKDLLIRAIGINWK